MNELLQKGTKKKRTYHGGKGTRLYSIWESMQTRCNNPNSYPYKYYGGKGVKIEWESFLDFIRDMESSYIEHVAKYGEKETTLDRIDNNGNYSKENCRWADKAVQSRNQSRNRMATIRGETKCLKDWVRELKLINISTVYRRMHKGMSLEEALTKPADPTKLWREAKKKILEELK